MTRGIQASNGGHPRRQVGEPAGLGAELAALMDEIELYLAFWEQARDGGAVLGDEDGRSAAGT